MLDEISKRGVDLRMRARTDEIADVLTRLYKHHIKAEMSQAEARIRGGATRKAVRVGTTRINTYTNGFSIRYATDWQVSLTIGQLPIIIPLLDADAVVELVASMYKPRVVADMDAQVLALCRMTGFEAHYIKSHFPCIECRCPLDVDQPAYTLNYSVYRRGACFIIMRAFWIHSLEYFCVALSPQHVIERINADYQLIRARFNQER